VSSAGRSSGWWATQKTPTNPHLHVQAQNNAISDVNSPPAGLTTYPLLFDDAQVRRRGRVLPPQSADVRRGDRFSTIG
jgi:hypothetical protein